MKKEMEDRITELSTQIVLVRAQVEEREAKLDVSSKEVDEVKDQLAQAMNELNQLRATNLQLSGSDDAKGKELLALKASHDRLRQLYNATSQALDLRTSDLEEERRRSESLGLASRLNDTTSSDDVVGLLQASNERIHAFASFMADQFDLSVSSQQGAADFTSTDMEEAKERAEEILGSRMVHLLMQSGQKRKAELVRLAFQAGICAYAEWMVSSWMFEDPGREGVLNTVYESMRKSEPSPLLGLWRSLTRKHGQKTTKVSSSDLSIYFLDALINVLIVSGFRATHMSLHSHITTAFPEQIALLVQDATKLNKSIGEEVVEYDLEVVHIPPETPFDPVYMEDASGKASGKGKKDRVLCTVELGLLRLVKNETNGKWENRVLVKPRVLLQSAI
ncbi:hypothetical protein DL96DRAFT_1232438 [Flagelloscypha sp. PMI_526]|nr:hypothetical protein DL96DRAFT_1232438 [Flagelloscypha sp. PMI_526]